MMLSITNGSTSILSPVKHPFKFFLTPHLLLLTFTLTLTFKFNFLRQEISCITAFSPRPVWLRMIVNFRSLYPLLPVLSVSHLAWFSKEPASPGHGVNFYLNLLTFSIRRHPELRPKPHTFSEASVPTFPVIASVTGELRK